MILKEHHKTYGVFFIPLFAFYIQSPYHSNIITNVLLILRTILNYADTKTIHKRRGDKKLKFDEIYDPIRDDLNFVENDLKNVCSNLSTSYLQDIIGYFFEIPGKRLRPTLAFLSAGIVNNNLSENTHTKLIQFASGIELMHSASLIHDDVIDGDLLRRGQKTINKLYGKKIAVLAGDVVYSLAFSKISNALPKEFEQIIVELTEYMCASEVLQAQEESPNRDTYLNIIKGKTALFMSISCKIAALLAGGTKEQIDCLEQYGLNLGMAYQIMDDCNDKDINVELKITFQDAVFYGRKAMEALEIFDDSLFKLSMAMLVKFILGYSNEKVSNA